MTPQIPVTQGSFVPCCYFPLLTVLIDDNIEFLQLLQRLLGERKNIAGFSNATQLFHFIEKYKNTKTVPLHSYFSLREGDTNLSAEPVDIQVSDIAKILQRKDRFNEPGVMLVDYAMPEMNGVEVSQKMKQDLLTSVKIIMLTGEADDQVPVYAFNEAFIDKFIRKNVENYLHKVKETIADLEMKYFQEMSNTILEAFRARSNFILEEPEFIRLFNQLCEENKIQEYYLFEDSGSFILLDEDNNMIRLIIKTEKDMNMLYDLAFHERDTSEETLKKLASRRSLVYFSNQENQFAPATTWRLEEAKSIHGRRQSYYYSIIRGTKDYPLPIPGIFTYAQYLSDPVVSL